MATEREPRLVPCRTGQDLFIDTTSGGKYVPGERIGEVWAVTMQDRDAQRIFDDPSLSPRWLVTHMPTGSCLIGSEPLPTREMARVLASAMAERYSGWPWTSSDLNHPDTCPRETKLEAKEFYMDLKHKLMVAHAQD